MRKLNTKILVAIFLLALVLRVFRLGTFPVGFHADEVRVGWNAVSILKTGEDDRGNRFALYYNTFGDFRPTGIFYLTIPFIAIFGSNEFAVRFPAALLGALTVFPLYFFVLQLTRKDSLALGAGALLAISPWHISLSRATSEAVVSLFLALTGLYFFLRLIKEGGKKPLLLSLFFLGSSYFFYHSVRLLAPVFLGAILLYYWRKISKASVKRMAVGVLLALFALTLFLVSDKEARGRFSQVSIFTDLDVAYELSRMPFEEGPNRVFIARLFHNKPSVYTRRLITEYADYFSPNFLIGQDAKPARYTTVGVGLLTYLEAFLLVLGLVAIAQGRQGFLPLLLLLIAPLPAALTTEDAPNLHRASYMIPFLSIIEAYGFDFVLNFAKSAKGAFSFLQGKLAPLVSLLLTLNLVFFLHMYFVHNRVHLPLYRNIGAKELAEQLDKIQDNYDRIVLTNIPDDPYPWIAFFTGREPAGFNQDAIKREEGVWSTENFVFTGQRCPSRDAFKRPEVKRLLVVDAEACASESPLREREDVEILTQIKRPDGSEVYTLWSRIEE